MATSNPSHRPQNVNLLMYATVFVTGAAIMTIELLGTRIIAPFYGASLYIWTSLISVTMIALAAGYFVGGRWADRTRNGRLPWIIGLAGLTTLAVPLLSRWVLPLTDPLGLRLGGFTSALLLFFPCLSLLGMVSPIAIKLATDRLAGVGTSAGTLYAVSTVGSVIGTLALGFFLFPAWGSRAILSSTGIVLLVLALLLEWVFNRRPRHLVFGLAVLAFIGLYLFTEKHAQPESSSHGYRVLSEQESLYGWVRVLDNPGRNLRLLSSDASVIGAASIDTGTNRLGYQTIVAMIPKLSPVKIRRALLIGQGAGHMATVLYEHDGIVTDTLEIDPAVATAATRFFGFRPSGQARVADARHAIRGLKGPYDLIIHDCFTGGSEPTHLLSKEVFETLQGLLAPEGLLALNYVSFTTPGLHQALASVAKTVMSVFAHMQVYVSEPGPDFNDFVMIASRQPLSDAALQANERMWLQARRFDLDYSQGVLLTDDFNPLESLQLAKAERYRALVREWLGEELMLR